MEVGPDHAARAAAPVAALSVVAEAGEHATERLGPRVEVRSAGMVLESCDRARLTRNELALE